jgi:hypothetical protein
MPYKGYRFLGSAGNAATAKPYRATTKRSFLVTVPRTVLQVRAPAGAAERPARRPDRQQFRVGWHVRP